MERDPLVEYYGKFNEDKRLDTPHGKVEYLVSMKYIHEYLLQIKAENGIEDNSQIKILDLGAGTGKYSIALAEEGYEVWALEYVKHNLSRLKARCSLVRAYQGDARNLKRFPKEYFDLVLIFGPMYHLFGDGNKAKVLSEVYNVLKSDRFAMAAYCMNEYGVVTYGIREGHMTECLQDGRLDEAFHCRNNPEDLYDYVRCEDIFRVTDMSGFKRVKLITPDGPANYIRDRLRLMNEQQFDEFVRYVEAIAERQDSIGAAGHTIDILRKE